MLDGEDSDFHSLPQSLNPSREMSISPMCVGSCWPPQKKPARSFGGGLTGKLELVIVKLIQLLGSRN